MLDCGGLRSKPLSEANRTVFAQRRNAFDSRVARVSDVVRFGVCYLISHNDITKYIHLLRRNMSHET